MKRTYLSFLSILLAFCILPYQTQAAPEDWEPVLQQPYISSIETTPWGLLAGERDSRTSLGPYNGLYISKDLGSTWVELGLEYKGITDIKYFDNKIYATTYYSRPGDKGLFISDDQGYNWIHPGMEFSSSSVDRNSTAIFLGTYAYGLWVSRDEGETWDRDLAGTWPVNEVYDIVSTEDIVVVSATNHVYASYDDGYTWNIVNILSNKNMRNIAVENDTIVIGSSSPSGIYVSNDLGNTWVKSEQLGDVTAGAIIIHNSTIYSGYRDPQTFDYSVVKSTDLGISWQNIGPLIPISYIIANDAAIIVSEPSKLYYVFSSEGVYSYGLSTESIGDTPILSIPWSTVRTGELMDNISAFFDHQYPLLGYQYIHEPVEYNDTTFNFLGFKDKEPNIYYSSHSGTDFSLPYGTPVLAAAPGYARYFYCSDCGHSIIIEHTGGYRTIYMHMQKDGLVTMNPDDRTWVEQGNTIGKVGMTGYTTGPHLHFEVQKDTNANGDYTDDYPHGRVDPFGWKFPFLPDPWPAYTWTDIGGTHTGTASSYLWLDPLPKYSAYTGNDPVDIPLNNKVVSVPSVEYFKGITTQIIEYSQPSLRSYYENLKYVPHTSMLVNIIDHFGNTVDYLPEPAGITIKLEDINLSGIILESLKIYYFHETNGTWIALNTIYDAVTNSLTAQTNHFSRIAVFGEKVNTDYPTTHAVLDGTLSNGWYTNYPQLTLSADNSNGNDVASTFYSIFDENSWEVYTEPLIIEREGIFPVYYRSIDTTENLESTKEILIKVDTQGKWKKSLHVRNTGFLIQN